MNVNLALLLNQLGVGLSTIASMSKSHKALNSTGRRWCRGLKLKPKLHTALARSALPFWGHLKRKQHPRSSELWAVMDIAPHPNLAHVIVFIFDIPEERLAQYAGVSIHTVRSWLYLTDYLSDTQKDKLAPVYRDLMTANEDDPRAIILNRAWTRKKPDNPMSAIARCLSDYHRHCEAHWTKRECAEKLMSLGHGRSVVYQALR